MEHIHIASAPYYDLLEVPYLYKPEHQCMYDGQGFLDFPKRKEYDKKNGFLRGDFTQGGAKTLEEAASFLQQWLFFGLLADLMSIQGVEVQISDFTYTNEQTNQVMVSTRNLPEHLNAWAKSYTKYLNTREPKGWGEDRKGFWNERSDTIAKIASRLVDAHLYVTTCLAMDGELHKACPLSPEVSLSIMCLVAALDRVCGSGRSPSDWGRSELAISRLQELTWCPSDIEYLCETGSAASVYFAGLLGPRKVKRSHYAEKQGKLCNKDECVANQTDENNYKTSHVEGCDGCSFIGAQTKIEEILKEAGGMVVLVFDSDSRLQAFNYSKQPDPRRPYVALSHIWADGLGNPHFNTLPVCQLKRIQALVNGLYEDDSHPVPFWIDTICVPLKESLRKTAIQHMKYTYEYAGKVLVLDAELQQYSREVPVDETLFRIACSNWMRRLWTLQEGSLGKTLHFQFQDGVVAFHELQPPPRESFTQISSETGSRLSCFDNLRFKIGEQGSMWLERTSSPLAKEARRIHIWEALRWRSTSKQEDELICVGTLLSFDKNRLESVPKKLRMKKFVSMQGSIPTDLVFARGARLAEGGLRWVPASFLFRGVSISGGLSFIQDSGMIVAKAGFLLPDAGDSANECGFYIVDDHGVLYRFDEDKLPPAKQAESRFSIRKDREAAIILQYPVLGPTVLTQCRAVVVDIYREDREDHGRLYCLFCRAGIFSRIVNRRVITNLTETPGQNLEDIVLEARALGESQGWHIG
ncbi:hypothetical protein H2201_009055 [Coniosporium apollinis]|uniref:Heterokaryon incompatibility domain-containing protein n=1 Tax=Coniosporium apollinis TaxID=61459 RepID=A0ABQ9NFN0_9PEZI|nr:hypothetical protein H2201_009055 [Coniosporium apollinis]